MSLLLYRLHHPLIADAIPPLYTTIKHVVCAFVFTIPKKYRWKVCPFFLMHCWRKMCHYMFSPVWKVFVFSINVFFVIWRLRCFFGFFQVHCLIFRVTLLFFFHPTRFCNLNLSLIEALLAALTHSVFVGHCTPEFGPFPSFPTGHEKGFLRLSSRIPLRFLSAFITPTRLTLSRPSHIWLSSFAFVARRCRVSKYRDLDEGSELICCWYASEPTEEVVTEAKRAVCVKASQHCAISLL